MDALSVLGELLGGICDGLTAIGSHVALPSDQFNRPNPVSVESAQAAGHVANINPDSQAKADGQFQRVEPNLREWNTASGSLGGSDIQDH